MHQNERKSSPGTAGTATIRERIREALLGESLTARDLSQLIGIPERDVATHLEHVARSVKHKDETLAIDPPACFDCGFTFAERHRYTRPGHCPRCRGRRISLPRFHIEGVRP